jgi:hypothetical protein
MSGANPAAVQRILRHSDPRITTEVYGHLLPGYLRDEIDRLRFGVVPGEPESSDSQRAAAGRTPFAAYLLQSGSGTPEGPDSDASGPNDVRRLDSVGAAGF